MFSGEIYYYWPLNSSEKVDKIVGKTSFFFAYSTALLTQYLAVMYTKLIKAGIISIHHGIVFLLFSQFQGPIMVF